MTRWRVGKSALALMILGVVATGCNGADTNGNTAATTSTSGPATTSTVGGDEMGLITTTAAAIEALPLALTPSQPEGPYYPVEKLDDQDSDLTAVVGLDGAPAGSVLLLRGQLLRSDGTPVAGGTIDIWQTDTRGIYLHPGDPKTADRDRFFQFSGVAVTDGEGAWSFRTIDPGYYEPRPRHIHVKVRVDGEAVLITQIYFSDDPETAGIDELLVAGVASGTDDQGRAVLVAEHRIVLP